MKKINIGFPSHELIFFFPFILSLALITGCSEEKAKLQSQTEVCVDYPEEDIQIIYPVLSFGENDEIYKPSSVKLDKNGIVYIVNQGDHCIVKFTGSGDFIGRIGREGQGPGEFKSPSDIAIAENGDLFVLGQGNSRVQRLTPNGKYLSSLILNSPLYYSSLTVTRISMTPDGDISLNYPSENNLIKIFSSETYKAIDSLGYPLKFDDTTKSPNGEMEKAFKNRVFWGFDSDDFCYVYYLGVPRFMKIDMANNIMFDKKLYGQRFERSKKMFEEMSKNNSFHISINYQFMDFAVAENGDTFVTMTGGRKEVYRFDENGSIVNVYWPKFRKDGEDEHIFTGAMYVEDNTYLYINDPFNNFCHKYRFDEETGS